MTCLEKNNPLKQNLTPKSHTGGVTKNKLKTATPSKKKIDFWKNFLTNSGGKVGRVIEVKNKANLAKISNVFTNPCLSRLPTVGDQEYPANQMPRDKITPTPLGSGRITDPVIGHGRKF